ncbi:unnamed protein product, partial [Rotaria sordida]
MDSDVIRLSKEQIADKKKTGGLAAMNQLELNQRKDNSHILSVSSNCILHEQHI